GSVGGPCRPRRQVPTGPRTVLCPHHRRARPLAVLLGTVAEDARRRIPRRVEADARQAAIRQRHPDRLITGLPSRAAPGIESVTPFNTRRARWLIRSGRLGGLGG